MATRFRSSNTTCLDLRAFKGGCYLYLLVLIERLPHQDVFPNGAVEYPSLLGDVSERPVGREGAVQEVHLKQRTRGHEGRGGTPLRRTHSSPTCSRMLEISELFPLPTFPQTPSRFPFRKQHREGQRPPALSTGVCGGPHLGKPEGDVPQRRQRLRRYGPILVGRAPARAAPGKRRVLHHNGELVVLPVLQVRVRILEQ